jgi:D-sedoheptulose 7-phosphate isomerase
MSINELFQSIVDDHATVLQQFCSSETEFKKNGVVAGMLLDAYREGNKLLLCGNGGSATDAQHIATEFVSRFFLERKALDAEALTVNTSSLTAIANDYTFDKVFSRQVEAKGKPGDVLIGITTSGTSRNILAAFEVGKKLGMKNICFTGEKAPASLDVLCDVVLRVPSSCTPRIQEMHILIGHMVCECVEKELFGTSTC